MADQAIRLDPNFQPWAAGLFAYTYFAADRYEDSLRMLARLSSETYNRFHAMMRAASPAALGRIEEAQTWVAHALELYPDMTIEEFVNQPGYNEDERRRFVETMRLAGFPVCAEPARLEGIDKPVRLPECSSAIQ